MATAPRVQMDDVDAYEDRLAEFLTESSPAEIHEAVTRASVFIETLCENGGPKVEAKLNQVNNATSLFGRAIGQLERRIAKLEKELAAAQAEWKGPIA